MIAPCGIRAMGKVSPRGRRPKQKGPRSGYATTKAGKRGSRQRGERAQSEGRSKFLSTGIGKEVSRVCGKKAPFGRGGKKKYARWKKKKGREKPKSAGLTNAQHGPEGEDSTKGLAGCAHT